LGTSGEEPNGIVAIHHLHQLVLGILDPVRMANCWLLVGIKQIGYERILRVQIQIQMVFFLGQKSRIEYAYGQYILCRIVIFIIFGSLKFNFEFPDTNAVRIVTDIKCPDSDTVLPFECLTLSVGQIISAPLSSLVVSVDIS
jgi:hypothetical protein